MPDVFKHTWDGIGDAAHWANDNVVKPTTQAIDSIPVVGPYIVPLALAATGNPLEAAAYSGFDTGEKTGNPLAGLLAAGGSYAGNALGSSLGSQLGDTVGGSAGSFLNKTPANVLGSGFATATGSTMGSTVGNALGSASIGSFLGGAAGSNIGNQLGSNLGGGAVQPSTDPATPWSPSRAPSLGLPQSLSQFGNLDQDQQLSNIANKGVYGGGNGPEESKYFLNLVNNRLVDPGGHVGGMDQLNPIENSYLAQLGLGGYGNSNDLLKGIQNYSG